jgi:hypothetical protein
MKSRFVCLEAEVVHFELHLVIVVLEREFELVHLEIHVALMVL